MLAWIMVIILMLLFFVMMFGIGFILNMLVKTTWLPTGIYIVILLPMMFIMLWKRDMSIIDNLLSVGLQGYLTAIAGFAGAYISGITIHYLRRSGYQMF